MIRKRRFVERGAGLEISLQVAPDWICISILPVL
jgi:hypothetical protein